MRGVGRLDSLEDIRDTVITARNGVPLFLRDVADVREGTAIRRGIASRNGKETIVALIIKQPNADTVKVVEGIERAVEEMRPSLPKGVRLVPYYDQTHLIEHSLSSVFRAILVGGVLVILVLLVFLGHLRSTLIVAVSLPLWPVNPTIAASVGPVFQIDLVRCLWAIFPAALNIISPATTSPNRHSPCQVQRVTKYAPDWV